MTTQTKTYSFKNASPFFLILFIVLFLLKLGLFDTEVQEMSWWFISSPLWGPPAISLVFYVLFLGAMLIAAVFFKSKDNVTMRNLRYRNPPRR